MREFEELDRTQCMILSSLLTNGATDPYHGMTIAELNADNEETLGTKMTVWRKAANLIEKGYAAKGVMDGKSDTYYILEKGLKICKGGD